ncbi:hypothetical protein EDC04DRAFT_2568488 [Pisolithus marmoratus]|nr:hypothetical protein EDC04DRAFT_2568488 [Pisolithus marmoratus]
MTPIQAVQAVPENPLLLIPSLTQLSHFLHHAETNLGICNATQFKHSLELQGIGLDILAKVDDKILIDAGISIGNIIHLKCRYTVWWNSVDAKWKCSNTEVSAHSTDLPAHPPTKKVAYEKQYFEGGVYQFSSPAMRHDDSPNYLFIIPRDHTLHYECDVHDQWLPVPTGFWVDESREEAEEELNPFYSV